MALKFIAITAIVATVAAVALFATGFKCPHKARLEQEQNGPILTKEGVPVESWIYDAFHHWTQKHSKLYGSLNEKAYRLNVFRDNVLYIKQHRNEGHSYTLGINKFADLTQEEFRARYLTLKPELKRSTNPVTLNVTDLPASVDWRANGAVAPVKNQGQCGSCWAFSAVAALEGLAAIKQGRLTQFSEQQLVDCSRDQGNEGCNGGLMDQAFQYVQANGIQTEDSYTYTARDGKCHTSGAAAFKISGFSDVPANNNDQLAAAAAQQVLSVAIEADTLFFQFYMGGVFDNKRCGTNLDHGVSVVGYGVDAKTNKPYWIVRNSWGADWGENGYIRILKESGSSQGICGIAMMASYPTV